jgi:radical SAM protein with 4Fe4S-binding SPASM domain
MRPLTAYLKPTNGCSVGCSHCYLPESVRANKNRMSLDVVAASAKLLSDMAARQRAPGIHVVWHGGEPLGVPVEWFLDAGSILDELIPGHSESIQTSLIPYRTEHAELIRRRFDGGIGSSMDFTQRTIKGSSESYASLWMRKVEAARADGLVVIPGTVPSKAEIDRGREMVDWFVERDFTAFNVDRYNHFSPSGFVRDEARPSNAEHARFLDGLLSALLERLDRTGRAPAVNVAVAAIAGTLLDAPGDRWGTTCQHAFLVVEPDGSTNSYPDRSATETPFSSVSSGFAGFEASEGRRTWIRTQERSHRTNDCLSCRYSGWCRSGCPITPNGSRDGEDECSGYRSHLDRISSMAESDSGRELLLAYLRMAGRNDDAPLTS